MADKEERREGPELKKNPETTWGASEERKTEWAEKYGPESEEGSEEEARSTDSGVKEAYKGTTVAKTQPGPVHENPNDGEKK